MKNVQLLRGWNFVEYTAVDQWPGCTLKMSFKGAAVIKRFKRILSLWLNVHLITAIKSVKRKWLTASHWLTGWLTDCVVAAAPGPPSSLTVSSISLDSLTLDWDPPHDRNGHITGYTLKYQPGGWASILGKKKKKKKKVRPNELLSYFCPVNVASPPCSL